LIDLGNGETEPEYGYFEYDIMVANPDEPESPDTPDDIERTVSIDM
jgi:hypothetical protein